MDEQKMTVLEEIIRDVAQELLDKWRVALPEDQRTEENLSRLSNNALESSFFVIQSFMNKFNAAASVLKSQDSVD